MSMNTRPQVFDEVELLMQELIDAYKDFIYRFDKVIARYPSLQKEITAHIQEPADKEASVLPSAESVEELSEEEIRNTAYNIAVKVDAFASDFDPFEYQDQVESQDEHIAGIEENLLSGGESLISYFQNILDMEPREEDEEKAKELLSQILGLAELLKKTKTLTSEEYEDLKHHAKSGEQIENDKLQGGHSL